MRAPSVAWLPWAAAAVAVAGVAYWVSRRGAASAGASAGRAAADVASGAAVGVVTGIGGAFGVPETNADKCSQDIAAGRTWDASFSCPAGRFVRYSLGLDQPAAKGDAADPGTGAGTPTPWDMQGSASFDQLAGQGAIWWPMP